VSGLHLLLTYECNNACDLRERFPDVLTPDQMYGHI
jgi:hypothetical protein